MTTPAATSESFARDRLFRESWLHWAAGAGLTLGLFVTMAQLERVQPRPHTVEIEDLPLVSAPPELPPPLEKPTPPPATTEPIVPLTGLDLLPSDSPIKVAVAPPEIERYLPDVRSMPAVVEIGRFHREYGPKNDAMLDPGHVYQQTEVDTPPHSIRRGVPAIPGDLWGDAKSLRVVLLLGVDTDGHAFSARVLHSSGKPVFDDLLRENVQSAWLFSPAIRHHKAVKCMVEQAVRVSLPDADPFSVQ